MTSQNRNGLGLRSSATVPALVALAFVAVLSISGCGPKPDPAADQTIQSTGPKVVAPPAKPGAVIGAGNPPAGQPNHMSPAMMAQMQHYQSLAPKK